MAGRIDLMTTRTGRTSPRKQLPGQPYMQQPQQLPEQHNATEKVPVAATSESKSGIELSKYAELLQKQMAPLKLKDAEDAGDYEALKEAIRALEEHETLRDDFNRAVHRRNQINKFQEELLQACDQQNRKLIQKLLRYGDKTGVSKFCRFEVKRAEKLADELGVKALPVPTISTIDRKTMTELRSYSKPSQLVHRIMQAVFLLFDEDEEKTSEWTYCQVLCKPDGPNGFLRKIMTFRQDHVDPYIFNRVAELLQGIELREILKASPAAAIFYVWLRSMLNQTDEQTVGEQSSSTLPPAASGPRSTKPPESTIKRKKIIEREKEIFGHQHQHT